MGLQHLIHVFVSVFAFGKGNGVQCANEIGRSKAAKLFGFGCHLRGDLVAFCGLAFVGLQLAFCKNLNLKLPKVWDAFFHPLRYVRLPYIQGVGKPLLGAVMFNCVLCFHAAIMPMVMVKSMLMGIVFNMQVSKIHLNKL